MDRQNRSIINNLLKSWPKNTVAVSTWDECFRKKIKYLKDGK